MEVPALTDHRFHRIAELFQQAQQAESREEAQRLIAEADLVAQIAHRLRS